MLICFYVYITFFKIFCVLCKYLDLLCFSWTDLLGEYIQLIFLRCQKLSTEQMTVHTSNCLWKYDTVEIELNSRMTIKLLKLVRCSGVLILTVGYLYLQWGTDTYSGVLTLTVGWYWYLSVFHVWHSVQFYKFILADVVIISVVFLMLYMHCSQDYRNLEQLWH